MPLEFDSQTLPWVDRPDFETQLSTSLEAGKVSDTTAEKLRHFCEHGYVAFPGLLGAERADGLVAEHDRAWSEKWPIQALVEGIGVADLPELPDKTELNTHHYRLNDIQDASEPARQAMMLPEINEFLGLLFSDTPVAMQSLFFEYGSEQGTHQDFPYVQSQILSHLVGCWIACEDVHADNGPLFYYPGSHRIPKFDWGGGSLTFDGKDHQQVEEFGRFLEQQCDAAGLERQTFHARKGDIFLWHAALVHGGSPANDPNATRKSLVVHYSSQGAYPRDRRYDEEPKLYKRNGGLVYQRATPTAASRLKTKIKGGVKRLLGR